MRAREKIAISSHTEAFAEKSPFIEQQEKTLFQAAGRAATVSEEEIRFLAKQVELILL